ncbi:ABC transporter ATP-binding protein [Tautonia rosea]|uniref:ABC transporter ATP-binding protein n=1 Tax=Tautonia rosea TaxID=2728037 RepID=UPI001475C55D|nr:ABC transporter ATP-binding protein [Tautonia rosea]
MKPAIRVENLSKSYRIGARPTGEYRTLRESLTNAVAAPWKRLRELSGRESAASEDGEELGRNHFWALKDISFEVQPGEVVGIIGRNGAGKSTLLKILSRITEPTSGQAEFRGRIGSLLEVGTGFHQELTGRENIYLNGSILGMERGEIDRKFDEIVEFSGVEEFLDTPVKRYSSGMIVRLAFAVAAHLEPEIMIVDEVLAVGDSEFQRKCLGKMNDVANSGRTILFVSHNMAMVQNLCNRGVYLRQGELVDQGDCRTVVETYLKSLGGINGAANLSLCRVPGSREVIRLVEVLGANGDNIEYLPIGSSMTIRIHYETQESLPEPRFGIFVDSAVGQRLLFLQSLQQHGNLNGATNRGVVECHVPEVPLIPGMYNLSFVCSIPGAGRIDHLDRAITIHVEETDYFGTGFMPKQGQAQFLVRGKWKVVNCNEIT